jgi:hypothetical protein
MPYFKSMKTKIITLCLIGLLLFSCSDENPSLESSNKLLGKWDWVESRGGLAGMIYTPKSTGSSEILEFNDSICFYYVGKNLQHKGKFEIRKIKYTNAEDSITIIEYSDSPISQQVTFKSKDTLVLIDNCFDCYVNVYKRRR